MKVEEGKSEGRFGNRVIGREGGKNWRTDLFESVWQR